MVGDDKHYFNPTQSLTRAQFATVLWHMAGSPQVKAQSLFSDVSSGSWYETAITWAAINNVVTGTGGGKFSPNTTATREEVAVILWRYAGQSATKDNISSFPDKSDVSSWASFAMSWAVGEGIINGSDGKLLPKGTATRAQTAQILLNYMD